MKGWNKGKFRIGIALLLVMALLVTIATPIGAKRDDRHDRIYVPLEFRDMDDDAWEWAIPYIQRLRAQNVLSGYEDGSFRPHKSINRAEAMVTAVRLMGLEEEAEDKLSNADLHFRDADVIDERYPWAKGYITVGLENGLIDAGENRFRPGDDAERWWVAALMVRALGMQDEALQSMTDIPDFEDADHIPAGAIGYVNVAVEEELVSGYPDDTFRPNRAVTRAEMAVLLGKTGNIIEQEWAKVTGTVDSIKFDKSDSDRVYDLDGTIKIEDQDGRNRTFSISSALLVEFDNGRYMRSDQLRKGDDVVLWTKNGIVLRAELNLYGHKDDGKDDKDSDDQDRTDESSIREFNVYLENDKQTYKLEYKVNRNGKANAMLERKTERKKKDDISKLEGKEAVELVEAFLDNLDLTPEMSRERIQNRIFRVLGLDDFNYEELEIKIRFANGDTVKIEDERDDDRDRRKKRDRDRDDRDDKRRDRDVTLDTFRAKLIAGPRGQLEITLERKGDRLEAVVKTKYRNNHTEMRGKEAFAWLDDEIDIPEPGDDDRDDLIEDLLDAMDWDRSDIRHMEIEVKFSDGSGWNEKK